MDLFDLLKIDFVELANRKIQKFLKDAADIIDKSFLFFDLQRFEHEFLTYIFGYFIQLLRKIFDQVLLFDLDGRMVPLTSNVIYHKRFDFLFGVAIVDMDEFVYMV
jgi:hypothetical protein